MPWDDSDAFNVWEPEPSVQLPESADGFDMLLVTVGCGQSCSSTAFALDLASQAKTEGGTSFAVMAPSLGWMAMPLVFVGGIDVKGASLKLRPISVYQFSLGEFSTFDTRFGIVRVVGVRF